MEQLLEFYKEISKIRNAHGGYQAGPVKGKAQGWMKIIDTGLYGKKGVFFAMT